MSLVQAVRSLVQRTAHRAGYHVTEWDPSRSYPLIETFNVHGHSYKFWVYNRVAHQWYRPDALNHSTEAAELLRLVAPGMRVLEIGAHHGCFSVLLSRAVGRGGMVLGVEPNASNALVAQAQVTLNRLADVCAIEPLACSDAQGTVALSTHTNSQVVVGDRGEHQTARAVTGDELDAQYGPFGMLKVDVEGYEGQVLRGCRRLLARRPALALELHLDQLARFATTVEEIFAMIAADEYEGTMIRRGDPTVVPFDRSALPKEGIVNVFLKPRPA